jgi:plastocyanin
MRSTAFLVATGAGLLFAAALSPAAELRAVLTDRDLAHVSDTVIILSPVNGARTVAATPTSVPPLVMDQVNMKFEPEVLVVPQGAKVTFPNSDSVAHQVYSFSPTKRFALGLYRGVRYAPVDFEQAGLVVLGCNIHDAMIGYIFVADTPYFGKSNSAGVVQITDLPAGTYVVKAWGPRFKGKDAKVLQQVTLHGEEKLSLNLKLEEALLPIRGAAAKPKGLRY